MALNTTLSAGLAPEMKTFYDRLLLVRTVPMLFYAKFGQKRPIPANGGKTIEFRRFSGLAVAKTPLTEGTLYTGLKDLTVTAVTATVAQYGDAVGFSDLVSTTTIDPILTETTEILGEQSSETIDELVRDVVVAGTNVAYAGAHTARNQILAASVLTPQEVRKAVLNLKLNRAAKIGGKYHAIIHPRAEYDLISTAEWREAQNYAQTGRIFSGAIGELYGVVFWVTDKAPELPNAGATSTVEVYQSMFFGAQAFGIVDLAKHNLRTIYKALGSAGTADPLEQQQTMGWKVAFTAKILNDLFMVRLEHAASTATNV